MNVAGRKMKHLLALLACAVLGAGIAAIVALVAFPHVGNFSYAPPILVFPILSAWVSLPAYVIAMSVNAARTKESGRRKHPTWGVVLSAGATLTASIAFAALLWFREAHR